MWALESVMERAIAHLHSRLVSGNVTWAEGVDTDTVRGPLFVSFVLSSTRQTHLDSELLDDGRGGGLGGVVEDLVDTLVDDLTRHGRGEDDGTLLVAGLDPEVGSGLGADELTPNVDVVWSSADVRCKAADYSQTKEKSSFFMSKASLTTETPALATRPVTGPIFSLISAKVFLTTSASPTSHFQA